MISRIATLVVAVGLMAIAPIANNLPARAVSNNYTWAPIATHTDLYPYSSATSADGTVSLVVGQRNYLSHDSGVTWSDITALFPSGTYWYDAAVSANGMIMLVSDNTSLYVSADGGATWGVRAGAPSGVSNFTMSADGTRLAAATADFVYTSNDSGITWTQQNNSGAAAIGVAPQYSAVVMSSNGMQIIATSRTWSNTGTYVSVDGGVTWTQYSGNAALRLNQLYMSANGATATAVSQADYLLYVSRDGGVTWTKAAVDMVYPSSFISSNGNDIIAFDAPWGAQATKYVSHDQGVTWAPFSGGVPFGAGSCSTSASAGLAVLVINDCYNVQVSRDGGQTWALPLLQGNMWWAGAAVSADGTKLLVTDADGGIYTSKDSGVTWKETTISVGGGDFFGVASSADGSKLVIAEDTSYIYISNDGGNTWVQNAAAGMNKWYGLAMTPDGTKIVALANNDYIYISNDGGTTWTPQLSIAQGKKWNTVAISSDGKTIVAAEGRYNAGSIFVSNDGGVTWTEKTVGGGPVYWNAIAMSADGKKIVALDGATNAMYMSTDSGLTWTQNQSPDLSSATAWDHVSMSADGMVIFASDYSYKNVYVSVDGGSTWKQYNELAAYYDSASGSEIPVTMSADGTTLYVAAGNILRGIVKASSSPAPAPASPSTPVVVNNTTVLASTGMSVLSLATGGVTLLALGGMLYGIYYRNSL